MAPKQQCAKYEYVVTTQGPKILPRDESHCKDEESPADYNAGGYLPVEVGDLFNNRRYRVVRKLGWGHFSTVWLVRDFRTRRHSALKVVKSATSYTKTAKDEIALLAHVSSISPTHPGKKHIICFLDSFSHVAPEATHFCIVFEPLGENLLALIQRNKKKGVPRSLVRVITKQILLGLEYLHDECDLIHTDIKPENVLISIPDIEAHIHNELTQSPSPTSRRVGIPLPTKSNAGISIPQNQQRPRKQVQIFDSQPLASPRSIPNSSNSHMQLDARLDNNDSGSQNGSFKAQMHITRDGAYSSGTVGSLSSSGTKLSGGLPVSAPRSEYAFQKKRAELYAAKGITAVPSQSVNCPSTSSSSTSISSALALAGSSSVVSTPPTSLPQSLGNAVSEFMGGSTLKAESGKISPPQIDALIMAAKKAKATMNSEQEHSSAISASWKATAETVGSWKDKISSSFKSTKSNSSPNKRAKPQHGHGRSHSGITNTAFWKDLGGAGLAPAVICPALVSAGRKETGFDNQLTVGSADSTSSSKTARPSPTSSSLHTKKVDKLSRLDGSSSNGDSASTTANPGSHHLSLLTQTAPLRAVKTPSPSKPADTRASPAQQTSQVSAHILHKPSEINGRAKGKSRQTEHPHAASGSTIPSVSVTPTPAPPPSPSDAPSRDGHLPPYVSNSAAGLGSTHNHRKLPPLRTADGGPVPPPISIKIADLGNATNAKHHNTEEIQTRQYRSPEAIVIRSDWDARVDIWSLACVVFELLTAEYLFEPHGQTDRFNRDEDHIAMIIELLGDYPLEVKMNGKHSLDIFDSTGALRNIGGLRFWSLQRVLIEKYLFSERDAELLCDFLEPMLATDIFKRAHARDLKNHKWLQPSKDDEVVLEW